MKRLTYLGKNGKKYVNNRSYYENVRTSLDRIAEQLFDYEETGLTPQVISERIKSAHVIVNWLGDTRCSNCNCNSIDSSMPYCPNCGAKFDEPEEKE